MRTDFGEFAQIAKNSLQILFGGVFVKELQNATPKPQTRKEPQMSASEVQQYLKNNIAAYSKKGAKWEVVIGLYSTTPHATFKTGKEAETYVANYNRNLKIPQ